MYIAHINKDGKEQRLKDHLTGVAKLSSDFAIPELRDIAYLIGLLHDLGKYQDSFQKRISGKNIRVEHSVCGAQALDKQAQNGYIENIMKACIMGHHSGLPDFGTKTDDESEASFHARLKRDFEDISPWEKELGKEFKEAVAKLNLENISKFFVMDIDAIRDKDTQYRQLLDKLSFFTRYLYSCLVDADTIDTIAFNKNENSEIKLEADFKVCLDKINQKISSFIPTTELQKKRSSIQNQAFEAISEKADIFFMNMPTGSGKTLASMKFALERIIQSLGSNKPLRKLIYVIPFNSIIDQTAKTFEDLFQDSAQILRHQSSYSYKTEDKEDENNDYTKLFLGAKENWDAPIIITTAVQFFESLHKHKRKNLRKMHNIENSIIVFDEIHTLPLKYTQPCLQSIAYLVKYLNCEALFLTATMPDFMELFNKFTLPGLSMLDLIKDKSDFDSFKRCRFLYEPKVSDSYLIEKALENDSTLIVVNSKKTAQSLYKLLSGFKGKKYHLSTYMTTLDRQNTIKKIKSDLALIEEVRKTKRLSEEDRVIVISTSLIEAGVDLDFSSVFREINGLDSILQAAGRCNREGKLDDAYVLIFEREEDHSNFDTDKKELLKRMILSGGDLTSPEFILNYYNELYKHRNNLDRMSMSSWMDRKYNKGAWKPPMLPDFRSYGEEFNLIESDKISLIIPQDKNCQNVIDDIILKGYANMSKLENYSCSISLKELESLMEQHVINQDLAEAKGIYVIKNLDYYKKEMGIQFEPPLTIY